MKKIYGVSGLASDLLFARKLKPFDQISVCFAIAIWVIFEAVVRVEHEVQSQHDVKRGAINLVPTDNVSEHVHQDNPVPIADEEGVEADFLDASWAIPFSIAKDFSAETVEVNENLKEGSNHQPAGGHVSQAVGLTGGAIEVTLEPVMSEHGVKCVLSRVWILLYE